MKTKILNLFHKSKFFLLVILVSIPTFIELARPGYFPMHDDMQAMRVMQMDHCFQDGQFPCRWVPDMGYGYGYPQFLYYSPLPYYSMEIVHLIGFSFLDSVKIVMAFGFVAAGITMFILGRSLWGNYGGLLSSILYLYAPYRASDLYSRGAVAEFFGMIFLPLIFYAIYQFIKTKKTNYLLVLSLSYAGLLLSHNITTLAFTPLAAIWGLALLINTKQIKLLPKIILSSLLGIGLAAFFILPVVFEKPFAHIETMTIGYFNYLAHFVSIDQLFFSSFWGFGSSELGPFDDLSFTIGILHWLLLAVAVILSVIYYKREQKIALPVLLLGLFFSVSVFMSHQRSAPIWQLLSFLKYFQFPWRFLVTATFTASAAGGSLIAFTKEKTTQKILLVSLSFVIILFNFNFLRPESWINITDQEKFSGNSWDKQMTISIFDYLPIFAPAPPSAPAPNEPEIINGSAQVLNFSKGSNWQSGDVFVTSSEATVRLPLFYFPGFKLTVNNHNANIDYQNDLGLITFSIPEGKHHFSVRLEDTPIRKVSDILTIASLLTVSVWLFHAKNKA